MRQSCYNHQPYPNFKGNNAACHVHVRQCSEVEYKTGNCKAVLGQTQD